MKCLFFVVPEKSILIVPTNWKNVEGMRWDFVGLQKGLAIQDRQMINNQVVFQN